MGKFMETSNNMITYESGAVRSEKLPRYRDVEIGFITRVAEALTEGAEKYEKDLPSYEKNWKKGDQEFALDVLDHAKSHLEQLTAYYIGKLNGDDILLDQVSLEDHLGHLGANLVMLDYFERKGYFTPSVTVEATEFPETHVEDNDGEEDLAPGEETDTPNVPNSVLDWISRKLTNSAK